MVVLEWVGEGGRMSEAFELLVGGEGKKGPLCGPGGICAGGAKKFFECFW